MPRVLELFAKRGLVPARFHAEMTGAHSGGLEIDVQVAGLEDAAASHVAACLRGLFDVERVLVATKQPAPMAAGGIT